MIPKILDFEEMVSLYIKILKKTITDTELELFKYNLDISCCVPVAIFFKLNQYDVHHYFSIIESFFGFESNLCLRLVLKFL